MLSSLDQKGTKGVKNESNMCRIHIDKPIEAYCRKDHSLLCVVCILEEGHKTHDVITLNRAYKEEKLYVKHKLSNAFKNKDQLVKKKKKISALLCDINSKKSKAVTKTNAFYTDIIKTVKQLKKDSVMALNRGYDTYRKELNSSLASLNKILSTMNFLKAKTALKLKSETDAIQFLENKQDIEHVVKNYNKILELDLTAKSSKTEFNHNKEKFNLLQVFRSKQAVNDCSKRVSKVEQEVESDSENYQTAIELNTPS